MEMPLRDLIKVTLDEWTADMYVSRKFAVRSDGCVANEVQDLDAVGFCVQGFMARKRGAYPLHTKEKSCHPM